MAGGKKPKTLPHNLGGTPAEFSSEALQLALRIRIKPGFYGCLHMSSVLKDQIVVQVLLRRHQHFPELLLIFQPQQYVPAAATGTVLLCSRRICASCAGPRPSPRSRSGRSPATTPRYPA